MSVHVYIEQGSERKDLLKAHMHMRSPSCALRSPSPWWLRSMAKTKIWTLFYFYFFCRNVTHSFSPLSLSGPFGLLSVAPGHWIKRRRRRRPEENHRVPLLLCSHCKLSGRLQDCRNQIKPRKHSRAAVAMYKSELFLFFSLIGMTKLRYMYVHQYILNHTNNII